MNQDEFLQWLDEQDGPIKKSTISEEWPDFPWRQLGIGITVALEDGEPAIYKRDLRRAAQGKPNLD